MWHLFHQQKFLKQYIILLWKSHEHNNTSWPLYSVLWKLLFILHEQSSFSKPSVASPTSQLILQPFPRFIYVTAHSPILPLLLLRHSSFSNPSFTSPTSQVFHLRHLASRPCHVVQLNSLPRSLSAWCA